MYYLWQDLSVGTKNFELLTLTSDLLLKKVNLGHDFWTKRDKAFILHMCITCGKTFLLVLKILNLWPWPWFLTFFWKKLNLGHNFWTKRNMAFILNMCITCGKTFLLVLKILTLWPWPWFLTYFWKNFTLVITFEPREIGLSYEPWIFLMERPFSPYQNCWSRDLDL